MKVSSKTRVILVSLLAWAPIVSPVLGADRPLTLTEAIDLALKNNEEIVIERESLASARAALSGAGGAYDPVLEIAGGWRRSTEPVNSSFSGAPLGRVSPTVKGAEGTLSLRQLLPTGGTVSFGGRAARETTNGSFAFLTPAYGTRAGVELRQPILRGLAMDPARLSVRTARSERQGAVAGLRRTVTEVVTDVEQAYWSLVAVRLGIEVLEEGVRLAEEQLAETRKRVESGLFPETELAQPRAELERRTGDLLAAREALSRAENDLKLLILGDDAALWTDRLVPVEEAAAEIAPVNLDAALEQALQQRPELAVEEAALERRRAQTALARDAVRPSLDAVLSYDRFGLAGTWNPVDPGNVLPPGIKGDLGRSFESLRDGDFEAARVALVLGIPLRNRGARAAAASARSAQRQAEAGLLRARKEVRAEVLDAAARLETAGQRITAARAGREAASVQLSAEQDRYAAGLSTNFLVLTRQNDLSRARLQEISALTDYRGARAELARATGAAIEEKQIDMGLIETGRGAAGPLRAAR